eukprot:scaffold1811_cov411-Prasinococcus_capsulatus_cf.AAC.7
MHVAVAGRPVQRVSSAWGRVRKRLATCQHRVPRWTRLHLLAVPHMSLRTCTYASPRPAGSPTPSPEPCRQSIRLVPSPPPWPTALRVWWSTCALTSRIWPA